MVLGYDEPRPTRDQYEDFDERFRSGLKDIEGISLMYYGSFARGTYDPGRSDIDGLLVFESNDFTIDKTKLDLCSRIFAGAMHGKTVPVQITVNDSKTLEEGTFLSYGKSFRSHFAQDGLVVLGRDYRNRINFQDIVDPEILRSAYKLDKSRIGLFTARKNIISERADMFLDRFQKSIEASARFFSQFDFLLGGEYTPEKFASVDRLEEKYGIDLQAHKEARILLRDTENFDVFMTQYNNVISLWQRALTEYEQGLGLFISLRNSN